MSKVESTGMSLEASDDAPLDSTLIALLKRSLLSVQESLRRIAGDPMFAQRLVLAFGEGAKIDPIRKDWLEGNLAMMPTIAILSQEQMNGANGAFSGQNNRIYLSKEFISQNSTNVEAVARVLIEEVGHWVDQLVNEEDSLGDEGAIFAALVLGESLSDEALVQLKAENDAGIVTIDGKMIAVEQAFGTTAYVQFGTSDIDRTSGISSNGSNNIYVTGWTYGNLSGVGNAGRGDVFIAKYLNSGEQIWLQQFGTVDDDLPISGISADSSGNIYLAGTGPIVGTQRADVYLWKYSSSGTQLWSRRFGTSAFDADLRISTDASGNVLITGRTQGSFPGFANSGGDDVFVAKYLSTGTQFWIRQFGTFSTEWANGICADTSGNVYVSGYTQGSLSGNSNLGGRDAFLVKYSGGGSQLWVRQFGTSANDTAVNNATDSSGNIFVAGYTVGNLPSNSNLGGNDGFLAKYSTSGSQLWVRQFGTSGTDFAQQVVTDSTGNVYLAGYTTGSFAGYTNAGSEDVFVAKYSTNGTQLWVRQFGTSASDIDSGLSVSSSGNIYLSGYTRGSLPGNSNAGNADAFIIGIHPNGRLLEKQPVNLSVSSNTGTEAGSSIITVTITTPDTVLQAQTVDIAVSGSASATDYILSNSTITIPTDSNVGTVTFTVFNDTLVESTETAILTIGNLSSDLLFGATISQAIAIISNDLPLINLSISSNTGSESGTTLVTLTATTTDPVIGNQAVNLAVTGTSITTGDYIISNSVIAIPNGQTIGSSTFTIVNDTLVEGTETATISISSISSGLLLGSTTSQTVTITDNDFPRINLSVSTNAGSEAGTTIVTVSANASDPVIGNQTVELAITGTGITPSDYSLSNSIITIPNGQTTGITTLAILDDALVEGTETASLSLANPSSGLVLGSTISQSIILTDNDFAPPIDRNFDGIPDNQQSNIVSILTPNNEYVTFAAPQGQPSANVQAISNPDPATLPPNVDFPLGFFDFNIPQVPLGSSTTLTLFLPQGTTANSYWKYGATPDNTTPHWYDFTFDLLTYTGATFQDINNDGQSEIILNFVDGQRGDDDLAADGQIRDPGAPALFIAQPVVSVQVSSVSVSESSPYAVVEVSIAAPSSLALQFTPSLVGGSATIGTDTAASIEVFSAGTWQPVVGAVTIPAGSSSLLLRVAIQNDLIREGSESFQVSTGALSSVNPSVVLNTGGASGTITIVDDGSSTNAFDAVTNSATPISRSADNDTPTIAVSSITVSEASPFAVVQVSLSNASTTPIGFTPLLLSGSATTGTDTGSSLEFFDTTDSQWQNAAAAVSIAAGSTSLLLRTTITNDGVYEISESFAISTGSITSGLVTNPAGASGSVTIKDDGSSSNTFTATNTTASPIAGVADNDAPLPTGTLSVAVMQNGNESGPLATLFRLSRSGSTTSPLSVSYSFGGSALAGLDYSLPAGFNPSTGKGTISFLAGAATVDLSLASLDDGAVDGNRSLNLNLFPTTSYSLTTALATATIADNDIPPPITPSLTIAGATVVETDSGTNPILNLSVDLSAPAATAITVHLRTVSASVDSATAGKDYVSIPDAILTFLPGSTGQLVGIELIGDNSIEKSESFLVELFNATGANLPNGPATVQIVDNDSSKFLTINHSASTTPQTFSGGSNDDVLIGGSADDVINGDPVGPAGGVDRITGNGGGDTLTGGPNADLFLYPFFSDSTLLNLDRIRDFSPSGSNPDRIAVNASALPTALWNIGKITPSVTSAATSPSLGDAAALAFADKDIITVGLQSLGAHEAVLFAYETTPGNRRSQKWFLSVNDATPGFSASDDLLIDVTGLTASFPSGLLAVNNVFSPL